MTDEVKAALATLKAAAENEFESRRIELLERDLTNPPRVEQVDEKSQRFNDMVYLQRKRR